MSNLVGQSVLQVYFILISLDAMSVFVPDSHRYIAIGSNKFLKWG